MIIRDASALVEQLLDTPKGLGLQRHCLDRSESLLCPHLVDLEVTQALRRLCQKGLLSAAQAFQAIEDLLDFLLTRYSHDHFLPRIWELPQNLSPYDSVYVALAELLAVPLVTCDTRLGSAPGFSVTVEVF